MDATSAKRRRSFRWAVAAAALVAMAEALGAVGGAEALRGPENALYDAGIRLRRVLAPVPNADPRLVIVGLDDRSAPEAGSYASEIEFYAALLEKIAEGHPRLVFWNVVLNYELESSQLRDALTSAEGRLQAKDRLNTETRDEIDAIKRRIDVEGRIVAAMKSIPTIVPLPCDPYQLPPDGDPWAQALEKAWSMGPPPPGIAAEPVFRFLPALPTVLESAAANAQNCLKLDRDGVLRSELGLIEGHRRGNAMLLPTPAVVLAASILGVPRVGISGRTLTIGDRSIPLNEAGRFLVDYSGPADNWRQRARPGHPSQYSAIDLLQGAVGTDVLAGRTVLVGSVRRIQREAQRTPWSTEGLDRMSSLERIAVETDAILSGRRPLRRPEAAGVIGTALCVLLGIGAALLASNARPTVAVGGALVVAACILAGALGSLVWLRAWIDGAYPALAVLLPAVVAATFNYATEQEEKNFLQEAFSTYVAPEVVQSIVKAGSVRVDGEERELTILFADLRNFTRSSAQIPAGRIVGILNEHLTAMTDVILRHRGTLDKFIGDAVMAFWNAPTADPEHARHACAAAVEMLAVLDDMNRAREARGEPAQEMGVGIATGRVIVGAIGAEKRRFNYTAIGDPVNVASRLEGLTKTSDYRILVGAETRAHVGDALGFVELGVIPVKGREDGVTVFGLSGSKRTSRPR
ncbi:MAG TPA: adenylate/guanylate cyclase domain-containing protein [bacterium]|nr:adenylate/guanylate cyclase domain-containing protein [bacterium]